MSEIQAMRAIAKNPVVAPYISPKRLERVAKCCEHYQDLGYSRALQTANILKRIHHTEKAFINKFVPIHYGQPERFESADHQHREMIRIANPFGEYISKAKKIISNSILDNGGIGEVE